VRALIHEHIKSTRDDLERNLAGAR
jgi:hypothetical protein